MQDTGIPTASLCDIEFNKGHCPKYLIRDLYVVLSRISKLSVNTSKLDIASKDFNKFMNDS